MWSGGCSVKQNKENQVHCLRERSREKESMRKRHGSNNANRDPIRVCLNYALSIVVAAPLPRGINTPLSSFSWRLFLLLIQRPLSSTSSASRLIRNIQSKQVEQSTVLWFSHWNDSCVWSAANAPRAYALSGCRSLRGIPILLRTKMRTLVRMQSTAPYMSVRR